MQQGFLRGKKLKIFVFDIKHFDARKVFLSLLSTSLIILTVSGWVEKDKNKISFKIFSLNHSFGPLHSLGLHLRLVFDLNKRISVENKDPFIQHPL